jgi:hypothetical protein
MDHGARVSPMRRNNNLTADGGSVTRKAHTAFLGAQCVHTYTRKLQNITKHAEHTYPLIVEYTLRRINFCISLDMCTSDQVAQGNMDGQSDNDAMLHGFAFLLLLHVL